MDFKGFEDWIKELRRRLNVECEASAYVALYDVLENKVKPRIFLYGLDTNYNKIGEYSDRPFSVKPPNQGTIWANPSAYKPNKKKSVFFPGGYEEFRKVQGLNYDFVDLHYTGALEQSYQARVLSKSNNVISVGACIVRADKNDLANELEAQYSKEIFTASDKELLELEKDFEDELYKSLKKYGF